ncbi:MAG: hypothetical protein Q4F85_11025 [Prevotella sp.]|nr:hypothetical protein [Prevotella sp.]
MKILFPERVEEFQRSHPDAKEALERWSSILSNAVCRQKLCLHENALSYFNG